ncbi:hypothetical protein [Bacillus sp. PK3_68]|uniref:hypothetical protein n=1 Tax=Bacillus sp. PK3_68 TaxID=2027408 RepID=UPI000E76E563|nr:hypothetical protein [Bacillus sp. PK3_68]RJS60115.1 hypothetical protein CJ483_08600 [Bacillus sp. PK3_68]
MEALIRDEKKVVVNGEEIKVKSLGLQHLFKFIKILKRAGVVSYFLKLMRDFQEEEPTEGTETDQETKAEERQGKMLGIVFDLVFSLVESETEIYDLIATLIGKDEQVVKDLPLDSFVDIVEMIFTSKDLKAFFKAVQRILGKQDQVIKEAAAPMANPIQ